MDIQNLAARQSSLARQSVIGPGRPVQNNQLLWANPDH